VARNWHRTPQALQTMRSDQQSTLSSELAESASGLASELQAMTRKNPLTASRERSAYPAAARSAG